MIECFLLFPPSHRPQISALLLLHRIIHFLCRIFLAGNAAGHILTNLYIYGTQMPLQIAFVQLLGVRLSHLD